MITSDVASAHGAEPVRLREAIQSCGVFLAVNPDTLAITHVSDNAEQHIGAEPAALLGRSLGEVLDAADLKSALSVLSETGDAANPTRATLAGRQFDVITHPSGPHLFVELEPWLGPDDSAQALLRNVMREMAMAQSPTELWRLVALGVRKVTGYDRVNISHFHPDGHGEVVGAAQDDEMESHLGFHFPTSNIPDEPSTHFRIKPSRLIANGLDPSVDLLADSRVPDSANIDLSAADLVASSARDLHLIHHLGHVSTFSLAVVRNGALTGVITCAHRTPRRLSYSLRDGLELVANQLSLQLGAMEEIRRLRQRNLVRETRLALEAQLTESNDVTTALIQRDMTLLDLIPADGAAVRVGGTTASIGAVPPAEVLTRLTDLIADFAGAADFSSDAITVEFPGLAERMPGFSGVLLRRLGGSDYMAWFRRESAITVDWIRDLSTRGDTVDAAQNDQLRDGDGEHGRISAPWAATESEASELSRAVESALNKARSELAVLALRDPLTGLPNRRAIIEALNLRLSAEPGSEGPALLYVDIDHFKSINDNYGHASGDAALIHLAGILQDTARDGDMIARLGGDEFVVLVDNVNTTQAEKIARRIVKAVRETPAHDAGWQLTASVGLTMARSGQDVSQLISEADSAMYRAKLGGRDRASK